MGQKQSNFIFIIILFAFLLRMLFVNRYDVPVGDDAAYYFINVQKALSGRPVAPPFIFYYLGVFALLFGDIFLAVKIGSSILAAFLAVPIYLLAKSVMSDEKLALLCSFITTIFPFNLFVLPDIVIKNMGGALLGLFLIYLTLITEKKGKKYNFLLFCFVYLLLLGTHLLSAAYFTAVIFLYLLFSFKEKKKRSMLLMLLVLMVFSIISIFRFNLLGENNLGILEISEEGLGTSLFVTYLPFIPFLFTGLYISFKKKLNFPLLFSWFVVALFFSQPFITSWWERSTIMSYQIVTILAVLSLSFFKDKNVRNGIAIFFIVCTTISTVAVGLQLKPHVSMDDYKFLKSFYNEETKSSVISVNAYHGVVYWLQWIGFNASENYDIGESDYILLEKTNETEIMGEVILDNGRFFFIKLR